MWLVFANPSPPPTTRPLTADAAAPFPAKVQELLGIKDTGTDVLPLIADCVAKWKSDPETFNTALDKRVDGLIAGPHPNAFLDHLIPLVEIAVDPTAKPTWKLGPQAQWDALGNKLWKHAHQVQLNDPKRAAEIARAAMMLAAMTDFETGWYPLVRLAHDQDDPQRADDARKLLALPDAQFDSLKKRIADREAKQYQATQEEIEAGKTMDELRDVYAQDMAKKKLALILSKFDASFRTGIAQEGTRYETISIVWTLLNLAKAKKDENGTAAIRGQLESWKRDYPQPSIQRWLTEALTRDGSPPERMYGELTRQPDGTAIPTPK